MWKKRMLCLVLVLCAVLLCSCQQKETYPTQGSIDTKAPAGNSSESAQEVFENATVDSGSTNYDDGSYDPASEEDANPELIAESALNNSPTEAPTMQSDYAGPTPVLIDPIDKPTPTPLPKLTFSYANYQSAALRLSFDAPVGWEVDESQPDSFTLTNPDPSMDYAARLTIRAIPVNKQYNRSDLTREIKGMLDTLKSESFQSFSPSNTANRTFLNSEGVYANYSGTNNDGVKVAGRIIVSCVNKTLYVLHTSYPKGYTETYVESVFNKFRNTVKMITTTQTASPAPAAS